MTKGNVRDDIMTKGQQPGQPAQAGNMAATNVEILRIVHQFNQPLTAISNYAQAGQHLLVNDLADAGALTELFEKIVGQCGRALLLSQELGKAVNPQDTA